MPAQLSVGTNVAFIIQPVKRLALHLDDAVQTT